MNIKVLSLSILSLAGLALWVTSCSLLEPEDLVASPRSTPDSTRPGTPIIPKTGTVHAVQMLDSHTWVVKAEDGTWYDPVNLPDSLKAEGTRVSFTYRDANNWGYTYAHGELIEFTTISRTK